MSIDKLLGDLIDALNANTAAINSAVHAKSEVTLAAAKLADKAKATKSTKDDDDDKPASRTRASRAAKDDDEEKPAKKAAAKDDDEDDRPAKKAAAKDDEPEITLKDVKEAYGAYLDVDDDDEAAARTAKVKKIVQHLGLAKISDAKPRDFEDLMAWLADLKKGKRPDLSGGEDSGKGSLV